MAQQIEVQGANSITISNGDSSPELDGGIGDGTDFGDVPVGSNAPGGSFFLINRSLGTNLNITSVTVTGTNASDFTVLGSPNGSVIAANGGGGVTLALDIQFVPGAAGLRGPATVTIVSDDAFGNSTYSFSIQGRGIVTPAEINVLGVASGDTTPSVAENTDYGQQALNVNANRAFYIENLGAADLLLTGNPTVSITGSSDFSVITPPATNTAIAGNNQLGITIRFTPTSPGTKNATISIANSDATGGEDPYTFAITGEGVVAPEMDIFDTTGDPIESGNNPPTLANDTDFGSVVVGGNNANIFTIRNNGSAVLNLTGTSPYAIISGANAGDFTVTITPSNNIAAAGLTNMQIRFSPLGVGTRNATVTIANNDPNEDPYTFLITGQGLATPDMRVEGNGAEIGDGDASPHFSDDTDFGSVAVGSNNPNIFTIRNIGTDTLNLTGTSPYVVIGGADAGEFSVTSIPGNTIGTASNTTFDITFTPTSTGVKNATISIANDDPDENPYNFAITGEGVAASPEMDITWQDNGNPVTSGTNPPDPTNGTDYGSVTVGNVVDSNFIISNNGTAVLNRGQISITGSFDFGLVQGGIPSSTIAANSQSTMQIRFTPNSTRLGVQTATVSIVNNDPNEDPYEFIIQGNSVAAPAPEIELVGLNNTPIADGATTPNATDGTDFGAQPLGSGFNRNFFLSNSGSADLFVTGPVTVSGPGASAFAVMSQPTTSAIGAGNNTLQIRFNANSGPSGTVHTAQISIPNNDSDENPYTFTVSGTVAASDMRVQGNATNIVDGDLFPSASDGTYFGAAVVVGSSTSITYTIYNDGLTNLILPDNPIVNITGTNSGEFVVTSAPASPVAPNGSTSFTVEFTPGGTGLRTALVSIGNNDPVVNKNPYNFAISGTGAAVAVPEIDIEGNGQPVVDGTMSTSPGNLTDFGSRTVGGSYPATFTINNTGSDVLALSSITISGLPLDFSFSIPSVPINIAAGSSYDLVIEYNPILAGTTSTATVTILNNDFTDNEATYTFAISGTAAAAVPDMGVVDSSNTILIPNGDTTPAVNDGTDFGLSAIGTDTDRDFLILNDGSGDLNITGLVTISGSSDFTIIGQPASPITSGSSTLRIRFTPTGTGPSTATVTILSNDPNDSPYTFDIQGNGVNANAELTSQMIGDFLGARNIMLLANQPDMSRRLGRLNPRNNGMGTASVMALGYTAQLPFPVDVQISQNLMSYAASSQSVMGIENDSYPDINKWDIWSEGTIALFDSNLGQRGSMGVVHTGVDYLLNEDALVGMRVQVDWMSQDFATTMGNVNGTGWMVGPYAMIRLDENFYFDVSATWGQSYNFISPFGTYVDEFKTSRWMINASLVGEFKSDNWTIRPTISGLYINENQDAYTDSLSVFIPGQNVAQGEIRFAPRVSYTSELDDGSVVIPWAEISGVYSFASTSANSASSLSAAMLGITGSVKAGVDYTTSQGSLISISGQYDGIGSSADSFGLKLGISTVID
ncbi:MAG: choice-of-anchor D domain-containing protein [Devosiaceae bacterium]|nr:choice-of-anchor D domain-containing protein [Devosiaceae bacterium]